MTEISSYEELGKKIDDSVEYLGKVAECAEALGTALGDAVECYSRTESEILQTVTSGASHDNSKSKSADKGEVSDKSYSQDGSRGLVTGNKMIDGFISKLTFDVVKSIVYDQMPEDLKKEVQKSDKTGVIDQLITDLVKYGYDQMFGSSTSMNLVAQAFAAIGRNYIENCPAESEN